MRANDSSATLARRGYMRMPCHVQATTVQDIFQMGLRPLGSFIVPDLYTEAQLISLWNATVALFAVVPGDQASINDAKQEVAQCLELMGRSSG